MMDDATKPQAVADDAFHRESLRKLDEFIATKPETPGAGVEIAYKISMIQKICNDLLSQIKGQLDALEKARVKARVTGKSGAVELAADRTHTLNLNAATIALVACNGKLETDPLWLSARQMLGQFVRLLNEVVPQKDSGPGLYIAVEWMLCYYTIASTRFGSDGPRKGMLDWRKSKREFARLQAGGKPLQGGWRG